MGTGKGRVTIGLYNSYDPVRFREAHRRVLARCGPLALAFEFNLATFGFPYEKDLKTPLEIAEWTADSTSIGNGGRYFVELAGKGRFSVFDLPKGGIPPQLGEAVAATSKPGNGKSTSVAELSELLSSGRSICLMFGLGPKGMPRKAIEICQRHLDITSQGISLETCTAIGSVCGALALATDRT